MEKKVIKEAQIPLLIGSESGERNKLLDLSK
jgi:hypothetical protein